MSEALEILKSCDAFLEGHFLLSSGRHSGAYCQMAYLQQYPDRCAEVMKAVADKVKEMDVDVIVGPAMGGIVYAYELARQTGKRAPLWRPSASSKRPAASALASPAWWTAPSPRLRLPSPFWPAP